MENRINKSAGSIDELWAELMPDFSAPAELHNYHANLQIGQWLMLLDIVSSPGGGFEGGYGSTSVKTILPASNRFEFVLYPDDFLNKIGKLFGMEDVVLGYGDLDDKLIVKTNNADALSNLLADAEVRRVFANLSGFSLKLEHDSEEGYVFQLSVQRALMNFTEFQAVLGAYYTVLSSL